MRLIKLFLYIFPTVLMTNVFSNNIKKSTVLVCYGKLNPESIEGYDYVILEPKHYSTTEIKRIKSQNNKVFAYISLGEVNQNATHYSILKDYTVGKNDIWNSYYLNLKLDKTIETLLDIASKTLAKGYDGLFLDNIDNFSIHGKQNDQKDDLIKLMKLIKKQNPKKEFIQNAGIDMVAETNKYINAIAIESIASNYLFKNKSYNLRDQKEFDNFLSKLQPLNTKYNIPIILIEYADTKRLYHQILKRIKPTKFKYFIGSIDLQNLPKFIN